MQREYGRSARNAFRRSHRRRRAADQEHHSQFQYKLKLNDKYDATGQRSLRRFVKDDEDGVVEVDSTTHQPVEEAPELACGEGGDEQRDQGGKLDR